MRSTRKQKNVSPFDRSEKNFDREKKQINKLKKDSKETVKKVALKKGTKKSSFTEPVVKTQDLMGKIMKKISLFYGIAIQQNPNSLEDMKKAIWAIYFHLISTDKSPRHEYCNIEWCKYLTAQEKKECFTHKPALNVDVQEVL